MDNFRGGLHSHAGAGARPYLVVCLAEFKHQNPFNTVGYISGAGNKKVYKQYVNYA
jgi:hypothetical protein